jgi:hypothetical protein
LKLGRFLRVHRVPTNTYNCTTIKTNNICGTNNIMAMIHGFNFLLRTQTNLQKLYVWGIDVNIHAMHEGENKFPYFHRTHD